MQRVRAVAPQMRRQSQRRNAIKLVASFQTLSRRAVAMQSDD